MDIWGLFPLFPWEGLPLPRFLGYYWAQMGKSSSAESEPGRGFKAPEIRPEFLPPGRGIAPAVLYQNTEELDVVRGEDGAIEKIIRHIKVTKEPRGR
jgi:hypothetical protein